MLAVDFSIFRGHSGQQAEYPINRKN
jgi:hypothetical protein